MMFGVPADMANSSDRVGVLLQIGIRLPGFPPCGELPTQDFAGDFVADLDQRPVWRAGGFVSPVAVLKPMLLIAAVVGGGVCFFERSALVHPATLPITVAEKPEIAHRLVAGGRVWRLCAGRRGLCDAAGARRYAARYDLVRANALEVLLHAQASALVSLAVFIWRGQVPW